MGKKLGLILAGGQSKRLFPVQDPKPLLQIDGVSLLEQAIERLKDFEVYIVSNKGIADKIKSYLLNKNFAKMPRFLIEPEGRDTAAAVGFGIRELKASPDDFVAVLSADHWVPETKKFHKFLNAVEKEIKSYPNSLFVAGSDQKTKEKKSHSQFGWIVPKYEKGSKSFKVRVFVEKPKGAKLEKVRKSKGLINGGIFFGLYETFFSAFKKYYPQVLDRNFSYKDLVRMPVDKAIFEKYENVRVVPLSLRWEDLGTWSDWYKLIGRGPGETGVQVKSKSVLISCDPSIQVNVFGCEDLAVIQQGSQILVMPLSQSAQLKDFLESI